MLLLLSCSAPEGESGAALPEADRGPDEPFQPVSVPETGDEPDPVVTPPDPVEPDPDPVEPEPDPVEPEPDPIEPDKPPVTKPPAGGPTAASCFADQSPAGQLVDYDQHAPTLGEHCMGTNHQDITGVERVVFVGDSITVGTPPTESTAWYRNVMADQLAASFGLEPPDWNWQNVDIFGGKALAQNAGDFSTCAKWGARTDDLFKEPHKQIVTCNPPELREKKTLIVLTMGGNDVFKWAQSLVEGASMDDLWTKAELAVADMEEAIHWAVDDPATFPNGVYVVFANTYEFTDVDSGNDLATCPGADLIGMHTALVDPEFSAMAGWMMSEYMRIAVETGTDMAFMGEHFCGHGYMYNQPGGRCYRGPNAELWLDFTCMHPSAAGHAGIAELFLTVIDN